MTYGIFRKVPCAMPVISWTKSSMVCQRPLTPPDDAKALPSVGAGLVELRIWDVAGTFRVMYIAKLEDAVYVLHCFQKKTQQTAGRDIELARRRFMELLKEIAR